MTSRRRTALSPSLFPFLAVLVCTLGTLILLLALVAQTAADTAVQKAAEKKNQASRPEDREQLTEVAAARILQEGEYRLAQLVSFRDAQATELGERRDQLTHLDDHIQRLREDLSRLSREVELAMSGQTPEGPTAEDLKSLQMKIEEEAKNLEELKATARNKRPRVVIVPHKGPNGTDRRPIYLECLADRLRVLPEGSEISIDQLMASDGQANPLDAALRTVRLHTLQSYGDTAPPYPLLVVRPDGIETYIAARQAMLDWDDQFGYELVPADVELASQTPDVVLKRKVDDAITKAVSKQVPMIAGIGFGGSSRASGGSGGSGGVSRVRTLSARDLDRQGRTAGFDDAERALGSFGQMNYGQGGYGQGGYGQGSYGNVGPNSGLGSGTTSGSSAAQQLDEHLKSAASEIADASAGNGSSPSGTDSLANKSGATDSLPTNSESTEDSSGAKGTSGTGMEIESTGTGFLMPNANQPNTSTTLNAPGSAPSLQPPQLPGQANANGLADSSTESDGDELGAATPSTSKQSSASEGNGGSQASGAGSAMTSPASQAGAGSTRGSDTGEQQSNSVSTSNSPPPQSTRKMLERNGRDWALPANVTGVHGNAVVRSIRVECHADRLILLPPPSGGAVEVFGFSDDSLHAATLQLASAVRDRIEAWGPSLPGGRWQPRLLVEVQADGLEQFQMLQMMMNGSGVDVVGSPAK